MSTNKIVQDIGINIISLVTGFLSIIFSIIDIVCYEGCKIGSLTIGSKVDLLWFLWSTLLVVINSDKVISYQISELVE